MPKLGPSSAAAEVRWNRDIYMTKIVEIDEKQKIFVIACQLMDGGQLFIPEGGYEKIQDALIVLKKVLKAYGSLYRKKVIHRDLKPQNILVNSNGDVKISDFGAAVDSAVKKTQTSTFTKAYASPQQMKNKQHTNKCDVYAIGCIFFQMLTGLTPQYAKCTSSFNKMNVEKLQKKLMQRGVPKEIIEFIQHCLREKEFVEVETEGRKVIDYEQSRLSWEDVYLCPLFNGEFIEIVREVDGSNILLDLRANAESKGVILQEILEREQDRTGQLLPFEEIMQKQKIELSPTDAKRLKRMFGRNGLKEMTELLVKLEEDQVSNYTKQEVFAFWQMFKLNSHGNGQEFFAKLKNNKYHNRQNLYLNDVNFTAFPLLPKMNNLQEITINNSPIQVLDVRLNAPVLKKLKINYCQMENIITIRGCPKLKQLCLLGNKLFEVQGLQMVPELQVLDLRENRLRKIRGVSHLKHLITLNLSYNRIQVIEGLRGCTSLRQLHLDHNNIGPLGDLMAMAQTKAPLKEIHLWNNKSMFSGEGQQQSNKSMGVSKNNKQIINQFRQKRPDSKVYLSIDQIGHPSEQFPVSVVYQSFPDGFYRISPKMQSLGSLGIKFNEYMNRREPKLAVGDHSDDQVWYFKHLKNNEYSICTHDQKEIIKCNYDYPVLQPYDEDEGQQQDNYYRWVFSKATGVSGNKDEVTVSIQRSTYPWSICWRDDGTIYVDMKNTWLKQGKQYCWWQIRQTKQPSPVKNEKNK